MKNIRTDLAVELRENLSYEPKGVLVESDTKDAGLEVTRVRVLDERGERELGKPKGNYITVELANIADQTPAMREAFAKTIGEELSSLAGDALSGTILVIGLGNRAVTPDALGPKTCEDVFITRHIKALIPEAIDERAATVCALAPGVLGVTGLETGEVVKSVVKSVHPSLVVAVDALASRKTGRIGSSVQISDTGISPGSGLGTKRQALNEKTLGAKVLALGVPMVTYASTIAADLVESALGQELEEQEMEKMVSTLLAAQGGDLIVTPKNIDCLIDKTAELLGKALNYALNPCLSPEEIRDFME